MASTAPRAPAEAGVGRQMAKGAGWTIMTRLGVQGIGLVSTVILARLLVPADFGLVALATVFSAALMAISEFGFEVVLIQNQRAGRKYYDTAWTLAVCRNATLAACLVAGAGPVAGFFNEPRIEAIVYCLALTYFVEGFANIGIVEFRKQLAFHKDLMFMIGAKLGMFLVAVPLALLWRNYWALVAGLVAGGFIRVALSYLMQRYRPRFSLAKWRQIMRFSKWLLVNNACVFLYNRGDTFVLGKILGAQAVGTYSIAYEIATLTTANLITPVRRALFPGYAKLSGDMERMRAGFADVMALAMLVGTPMAVGIGLVAEPLVHVALGPKWLASIPLIQVLAAYGFLGVVNAGTGPVYLALAKPHYLVWILFSGSAVMIPLLIFGVQFAGALGAAFAVTAGAALAVVLDLTVAVRLLKFPARRMWRASWRPLAAAAVMAAAVIGVQARWPAPDSVLQWAAVLVVAAAAGAATYGATVALLWRLSGLPDGAERHVLGALRAALANRFKRARSSSLA